MTNLFPDLTALENVRLAVQSRAEAGWSLFKVWNGRRDLIEKAEEILERVRLSDKRHVAPKALSHGDQRKLEVALLIAMEPKVFMFDEPTAGMSVDEVPTVLELIQDIKQRGDATVLNIVATGHDLLRFVPSTLGADTRGTWQMYFDGSDVGLTTLAENVDAVSALADGTLLVSTSGAVVVNGVSAKNEDVLRFSPTKLGGRTIGAWSLYFDGSALGFADDIVALEWRNLPL